MAPVAATRGETRAGDAGGAGSPPRLLALLTATPFRVALTAVGLLLAVAGLIFAFLFWQASLLLSEQVLAGLRSDAAAIVADGRAGGLPALVDTVNARSRAGSLSLYRLEDLRGGRLAGNLAEPPTELTGQPAGGAFTYRPGDQKVPRFAVAIGVDTGQGARLLVGRDMDDQRQLARRMQRAFLLGFGLLALAGLAAGIAISRGLLARIAAISETSQSIMAGDLSRRIPLAGSGDELDALAGSLNAMLERIELLMSSLREVSDNIAHDLKTPLNRLRNRAEAALREEGDRDSYKRALEGTIEQADDLIKTFNALLLIARLEAGALEGNLSPVPLSGLVRDVVELYEPLAEERGLSVTVQAAEGITIMANRQLVGQAVANMIDNAIKYSSKREAEAGDPRPITVSLTDGAEGPEIAVADCGPGIAAEDRARALRRFVRLEASRTQPGTGLGLSLVAAIARLHGATLRLEDNAPGLRIVIAFPRRIVINS